MTVGRRLPRGNKIQHLAPEIARRCWKPRRRDRTLKFAKLIDVDVGVLGLECLNVTFRVDIGPDFMQFKIKTVK